MKMTPRQRWIGALNFNELDRIPFWPKLDDSYIYKYSNFFNTSDLYKMHKWIGSDQHIWLPSFIKEETKSYEMNISGGKLTRITEYKAPSGNTRMVEKFDLPSQSWTPVKYPIKEKNDIRILTEIYNDISVEIDKEKLSEIRDYINTIGDDAVYATIAGVSPLMYFIQNLASMTDAHTMIYDYEDEVIELLGSMHNVLKKRMELISEHNPGDLIYLLENTSTTLVSPTQYREYNLKHINEYGNIISNTDNYYILHMCGLLKNLLPDLKNTNAIAFEAFTSPPVGDTNFIDGRTACPDKCLIGGTSANLWTKPADKIIDYINKQLGKLSSHRGIVVTSAGVLPPICEPETVKEVCDWMSGYKPRF